MKKNKVDQFPVEQMARNASFRIIIPVVLMFTLFAMSFFLFFIPLLEKHMMDQKREMIQVLGDSAWSMLADIHHRVINGELTFEEARNEVSSRIGGMRFGPEGKDYFWINDMQPTMIMHPYRSDLNGQDLTDFTDPNGKHLFVEFVNTVRTQGAGFVDYMWQWKDDETRIVPKISYVRGFEPWGWIIGTGLYVEDVHTQLKSITRDMFIIFAGILIVVLGLTFYITWQAINVEKRRKHSEKKLQASEERFKLAMEANMDGLWDWNVNTDAVYFSPGYTAMLNYTHNEIAPNIDSWKGLLHPEDKEFAIEAAMECVENYREDFRSEFRMKAKTGEWLWILARGKAVLRSGGGEAIRMIGTHVNITKRKEAEMELRESEERFRLLAENITDVIWILDLDLQPVYYSPSVEKMVGYTVDEYMDLVSLYIEKTLTPESLETVFKYLSDALAEEKNINKDPDRSLQLSIDLLHKDGSIVFVEMNITFLRDSDGDATAILGIARDITDRKRAEEALKASEEKYRNILESIEDSYFELGLAGEFIFFNASLCKMLGYSQDELMGTSSRKYVNEANADKLFQTYNEILRTGITAKSYILEFIRKDGSTCTSEILISPIKDENGHLFGFRGIARDVTERKLAEKEKNELTKQLQQVQKLESIGTLAGGVAHEFNNLLYVISGSTEILMEIADNQSVELLQEIFKATQRGARLVKQLLTFSRKSETNLQTTNINIEIVKILKMLNRLIPREIHIQSELSENLLPIKSDTGQFEQIMMNLCINARDAMPDGGTLSIQTDNFTADELFLSSHPDLPESFKAGQYVRVAVSDTGHGMDEEVIARIFDPFYTSKDVGHGSGLGLSVIFGIIKAHNGFIFCESEPDNGTIFKIYFPVVAKSDSEKEEQADEKAFFAISREGETILIVDDDEAAIRVTKLMVERLGYNTISANNGESALEIYMSSQKQIGLILLDLGMPGMGGKKCLEKLIEFDPDVKVIITSGYSNKGLVSDSINHGAKDFVIKPFNKVDISKSINRILYAQEENLMIERK